MKHENPRGPDRTTAGLATWLAAAVMVALLTGCAQMPFPSLPASLSGGQSGDESSEKPASDQDESTQVAEQPEPIPEPQETPKPGQLYEWSGDGRSITRIVIDTNEQKARFYAGNDQVGWTTIASGVSKHPTPRGEFAIIEKVREKRSNLYGKIVNRSGKVIRGSATGKDPVPPGARFVGASMPNFMRMTYDGIGMHAGPIPRPGQPASHGCIRMPKEVASAVFKHASTGTPVTVIGNGPDYGNYAERVARQQAEERARRAAEAAAAEGTPLDGLDAEIETIRRAEATAESAANQPHQRAQSSPSTRSAHSRSAATGSAGSPAVGGDPSRPSAAGPEAEADSGAARDHDGAETKDNGGAAGSDGSAVGNSAGSQTESTADGNPPSYSPPPPAPRVRSASSATPSPSADSPAVTLDAPHPTAVPATGASAVAGSPRVQTSTSDVAATVTKPQEAPLALAAATENQAAQIPAPEVRTPAGLPERVEATASQSAPSRAAPAPAQTSPAPVQIDATPAETPQAPPLGPPAPPPSMRSANQPRPLDEAG